jgi:Tfp pilus assembly protein PilX
MKARIRPLALASEWHRGAGTRSRGGVLMIALVLLAVLTILEAALIQSGVTRRRQLVAHERGVQAEWLAEAGFERAAAALKKDVAYTGEAWEVASEELNDHDGGLVKIAVEPANSTSGRRRIHVAVDYPHALTRAHFEQDYWIHAGGENLGEKR